MEHSFFCNTKNKANQQVRLQFNRLENSINFHSLSPYAHQTNQTTIDIIYIDNNNPSVLWQNFADEWQKQGVFISFWNF
jgi:hypothetical protein